MIAGAVAELLRELGMISATGVAIRAGVSRFSFTARSTSADGVTGCALRAAGTSASKRRRRAMV